MTMVGDEKMQAIRSEQTLSKSNYWRCPRDFECSLSRIRQFAEFVILPILGSIPNSAGTMV